jgi:hypothetical protein
MADSISVALASAVVGGALTYVTTIVKIRQDLAAQYDANLRQDRIKFYQQLWMTLEPLARYAPASPFTFHTAEDLATALRKWYFEQGGLFLSAAARDAYFALQDALKELKGQPIDPVPQETLKALMDLGSALRTHLSSDVGTRAKAMLAR